VAIASDGVVVAGAYGTEPEAQPKYRLFPSDEPVEPPSGVSGWPLTLPGGELAWRTEDGRLLRSDGSDVLPLGDSAWVGDIVADASGKRLAATWSTESPASQSRIGVFSRDGRPISAFSHSDSAQVGGWLSDALVAGNTTVPPALLPTPEPGTYVMNSVPAIFDLSTGEAHPLAGPFHELPLSGRNYVRAVLHGPFARVADTGSCLNVRAEPGAAADVLTCAADGVLLRDTGEKREVDGTTWRRVVTPAGVEGWADSQYLEVGTPTAAALSPCLPQFGDSGVAGGQADSGPFTFDLALYTDPVLKSPQEADHPSRTSDIPGVGWRAKWTYDGPATKLTGMNYGLTSDIRGVLPSYYGEVSTGQSMSVRDAGGIVLPLGAQDGGQIGVGVRIRTLEGTYGAALFFTLREQDGRVSACDVTVHQWSE
jgi:hypothetical protein